MRRKKEPKKVYKRYAVQVGNEYHESLNKKDARDLLTETPDTARVSVRDRKSGVTRLGGPTPHFHTIGGDDKANRSRKVSKTTATFMFERNDDGNLTLSDKHRAMYERIAGDKYQSPLYQRRGESREDYVSRLTSMIAQIKAKEEKKDATVG